MHKVWRGVCHECDWKGKWRDDVSVLVAEAEMHEKIKHPRPDITVEESQEED